MHSCSKAHKQSLFCLLNNFSSQNVHKPKIFSYLSEREKKPEIFTLSKSNLRIWTLESFANKQCFESFFLVYRKLYEIVLFFKELFWNRKMKIVKSLLARLFLIFRLMFNTRSLRLSFDMDGFLFYQSIFQHSYLSIYPRQVAFTTTMISPKLNNNSLG